MFYEKILLPIFVLIKAPNGLLAATHVDMDANRYTIGIFGGNPHLLSNQHVYVIVLHLRNVCNNHNIKACLRSFVIVIDLYYTASEHPVFLFINFTI